jgi:hypothetical protein
MDPSATDAEKLAILNNLYPPVVNNVTNTGCTICVHAAVAGTYKVYLQIQRIGKTAVAH